MAGIESLSRALLAQLGTVTGTRAAATVTVSALAAPTMLPRNSYLLPVVEGRLREHWAFKVGPNPLTLQPNGSGGDWTVQVAGTAVGVVSNLGGARFNLPAGTLFRFDPPIAGLAATATATTAATGGADGPLLEAHFYEDMESSTKQEDFFRAKLSRYPAAMLIWESSEPVEGFTTGVRQGRTRVGRAARMFRESFVLFVVTGRQASDPSRRSEGLRIMEAVTDALTDHPVNFDGEQLADQGGLEIAGRSRFVRDSTAYVYAIRFRVARSLIGNAGPQVWGPWDTTRITESLPTVAGSPASPLTVVDVTETMP